MRIISQYAKEGKKHQTVKNMKTYMHIISQDAKEGGNNQTKLWTSSVKTYVHLDTTDH